MQQQLSIPGCCGLFTKTLKTHQAIMSGHIVTSSAEHTCVFQTVKYLENKGWQASYLSPGLYGAVTPEAVKEALRQDTRLIAIMAVNNETGVKTDIEGIAKIALA